STRPERAFVARAARDIVAMVGFASLLGWASLAAVFGLVANAMVLAMQDRVRDHAVMKTLGFTGGVLATLAATEGLLLGLVGGATGAIAAAIVLSAGRFSIAVEGSNLELSTDPAIAATGIALAMLVGVLAGLVPGLQSARGPIVSSLRTA
ncbi:MAG: FtsX-like permease family protein, partial [Phycisphaerales bacterium]